MIKKMGLVLLAGVFCLSLLGLSAAGQTAPREPLFVDDRTDTLSDVHRDAIRIVSRDLYEQTGIDFVVLLDDGRAFIDPEEYIRAQQIGGPDGGDGILLLVFPADRTSQLYLGGNVAGLAEMDLGKLNMRRTYGRSLAVTEYYLSIARAAYAFRNAVPSAAAQEMLGDLPSGKSSILSRGSVLLLAVVFLAVARSYRVSRRYRQKYLKGHVRKAKTFTKSYDEEDQYRNDERYRIRDIDDD